MRKISPFAQKVYKLVKKVPAGKVTTYKTIARALNTKAYQAVGQALRKNPFAFTLYRPGTGPQVPCHRVIKSDGTIGGFNGKTSGKETQRKINLLKKEGVEFKNNKSVNLKKQLFPYNSPYQDQ